MNLRNIYTIPVSFLLGISLNACSQDTTTILQHQLGASIISIKKSNFYSSAPIVFIQLHHNETTAAEVAQQFSDSLQLSFVQILNSEQRLIGFENTGQTYRFDPNRMFSKEGAAASLKLHSQYSDEALTAIDSFSKTILGLLRNQTVVAVHNNTDEEFTLNDYIDNETGLVHKNSSLDPDDFFITTDSTVYERLKEKNFNVVWEWSDKLKDDGSLSIYCSRNNIRYVNVEAEHGHKTEQAAMLKALMEILK